MWKYREENLKARCRLGVKRTGRRKAVSVCSRDGVARNGVSSVNGVNDTVPTCTVVSERRD
jgi:hypothetical protein